MQGERDELEGKNRMRKKRQIINNVYKQSGRRRDERKVEFRLEKKKCIEK